MYFRTTVVSTSLISLLFITPADLKFIRINDSNLIIEENLISFYLDSYPVIVAGEIPVNELFPPKQREILTSSVIKVAHRPGETRGIPPYNWVKVRDQNNEVMGVFTYKTINTCNYFHNKESLGYVFDHVSINQMRKVYRDRASDMFQARTIIGNPLKIHTVTTSGIELYSMTKAFANLTSAQGAHSDTRVILCPSNCSYAGLHGREKPVYLFSGAVHYDGWQEKPYISFLNDRLEIVYSKILVDPNYRKKSQKNWLPFWDGCKLMFSKRFGPEHVVGEFKGWQSKSVEIEVPDVCATKSPSQVPNKFLIRGSAIAVKHPHFQNRSIGCVHLRSKTKVYRHALYVMSSSYPYEILSFSPLFAFKPYRPIEFVMSLFVSKNGDLELSHGSMDCEPKLAIMPLSLLSKIFEEFYSPLPR